MKADRRLQRRLAKPYRRKVRSMSGAKFGKSYLLGAMAKARFGFYTKFKTTRKGNW